MNKYRGPQRRVIFPRPLAGVEMALKIRRRARLRRKEASEFLPRLVDEFGMAVPADEVLIDEAEAGPHRHFLRENEAIGLFLNGDAIRTVRRPPAFPATK